MNRWVWFTLCVLLGLVAFVSGWLMPAHLRAVDVSVLQKAGEKGPALIEKGLSLVQEQKLGPAQLLLQAAQMEGVRGWDQLTSAVDELAKANPTLAAWGVPRPAIEALSGGA